MDKIDLNEMKEDWLAGNAVVAFVGALLLGQTWEVSEGTVQLFRILTVPSFMGLILLALIAGLFGLSLTLALASLVTPLQSWALSTTRSFSTALWWVVLLSFFLSLGYAFSALPPNQWWSPVLRLGGVGMLLFIMFKISQGPQVRPWIISAYRRLRRYVLPKRVDDATSREPNDSEKQEAPKKDGLLDRVRNVLARCRWPESRGFWVSLSVAIGVVELLLAIVWWDWLRGEQSGSEAMRNVGLIIAASVAFPLAIWRALVADRQASAAQQGVLSERYQKSVDMLGSDLLSVRLGGIYALQSLIKEYPQQYYLQTMHSLCAFVRNPPKHEGVEAVTHLDKRTDVQVPKLRDDVQAIMDMMRNRNDILIALEIQEGFRLNMSRANLKYAFLSYLNLSSVDFSMANVSGALLGGADLSGASLLGATLSGTMFYTDGIGGSSKVPARGLNSSSFFLARSAPNHPPEFGGVVLDADTGQPLVWCGESIEGEWGK